MKIMEEKVGFFFFNLEKVINLYKIGLFCRVFIVLVNIGDMLYDFCVNVRYLFEK